MILGKVIGVVWGTKKSEAIKGYKIVMVRPVSLPVQAMNGPRQAADPTDKAYGPTQAANQPDRKAHRPIQAANEPTRKVQDTTVPLDLTRTSEESHLSSSIVLAVDCLDACVGDYVMTAMGTRVRDITLDDTVPTKTVVLGIVDSATIYPDCI